MSSMKRNVAVGSCMVALLALAGCQDSMTAPTRSEPAARLQSAIPSLPGLDGGRIGRLPAGARMSDHGMAGSAARAINPSDYVCSSSTPVSDWFVAEAVKIIKENPAVFDLLYNQLAADLIPTYQAILFETSATPQYFGYNGEYTKVMVKAERDVKRFFDIQSDDIQVLGMHGTVLLDVEKVAATYEAAFGIDAPTAMILATLVRNAVLSSKVINGGNHPLFTFNAVSFQIDDGSIPNKIVMGDGVLAGYTAVGLGDVAPTAIFAHEFAHQIQFANDYFDDPYATAGSGAEQTRYTELMADVYAAYYLTHKRGAAMNQKRVEQFLQTFYQVGDCAFTSGGHHGTPNQRMAAAQFGFMLADEAQKQGHILSSEEIHARFLAFYPTLIAPDAT
jgi:hypothetical protein